MNFYDQLKPKYKKRLFEHSKNYTVIDDSLIPDLKKCYNYSDLSMRLLKDLLIWLDIESFKLSGWDLLYGEFLIKENNLKN